MRDERDYPCWGCEYFQGHRPIKTAYDGAFDPTIIEVEIPICGRIIYVLAMGRCDHYKPNDIELMRRQWIRNRLWSYFFIDVIPLQLKRIVNMFRSIGI
jgi:hypothetical protein